MSQYNEEMVARLHEVYDPDADEATREKQIAQLVSEFCLSSRSVRGKLTTEGLYVKRAEVAKAAKEPQETRQEIVESIATMVGMTAESLTSFARGNRGELIDLRSHIKSLTNEG